MNIEGIHYSELDWTKVGVLWAYRLYPDGSVLFTYASRIGHLVLHTDSGSVTCLPKDILGDRSKLPEFALSFSRTSAARLTYRSGLPAVTRGKYTIAGASISISHPYFHFPTRTLTGHILPDRLLLSPTGTATTIGEKKSTTEPQTFWPITELDSYPGSGVQSNTSVR